MGMSEMERVGAGAGMSVVGAAGVVVVREGVTVVMMMVIMGVVMP